MLSLLFFVACAPVQMRDDTELNLDVSSPVALASPYVVGASFDLDVTGDDPDLASFTLESSAAGVLSIGAPSFTEDDDGDDLLSFPATAVGTGETTLRLRDEEGNEVLRGDAEVRRPTHFETRAGTDLAVEENPDDVEQPNVLVGGSASFRIDFFDGETQLAGSGGLAVTPQDRGISTPDQTTFIDDHDWITVEPSTAGLHEIELKTGGVAAGTLVVKAVEAGDVAKANAHRDSEEGAEQDDSLRIVAWGETAHGDRVYGVPFSWAEDGEVFEEGGDTFVYRFDEDVETTLAVQGAGQTLAFTIHGHGVVSDSDSIGCVVANVGPAASAIALALLGISRRRRR